MTRIYAKIIIFMISLGFSQDEPELFEYNQSTQQAFYFFNSAMINGVELEPDDWVGAFRNDICVGSRQWDISQCGGGVCDVPVMGNDGSNDTSEYMLSEETPTFKIYDSSENIYYDAVPSDSVPWYPGDLMNIFIDSLTAVTD